MTMPDEMHITALPTCATPSSVASPNEMPTPLTRSKARS